MNRLDKVWALEYSAKQDSYNVDLLNNILSKNLDACMLKNSNDYQIIYIGSRKGCDMMYESLLKIRVDN